MDASVSQAKSNCLDSVETLRDRWMQRDSEIIEALAKLQDSVEQRLQGLDEADERFAGIRKEMDGKLAAMAAASLDHREKTELQIAEAKRQLTQELSVTNVSQTQGVLESRCVCDGFLHAGR
jgi:hypothetical protein